MAGQQLLLHRRPLQSTHLASSVDAVKTCTRLSIPELDAAIGCTTSRGKQIAFVRRPRQGLDGGGVICEGVLGGGVHALTGFTVPNTEGIIVCARCKVLTIGRPRETTHLLSVMRHLPYDMLLNAHVVIEDGRISGPGGQDVFIPRESPNAGRMSCEGSNLLLRLNVP